jgi:hypothetical protein
VVAGSMGMIAIPGIAGVTTGLSVFGVVSNVAVGIGQALTLPAINRRLSDWRYNAALKEVKETIEKSANKELSDAAKILVQDIQIMKLSGDKSLSTYKLSSDVHLQAALKAINSALKEKDPLKAAEKFSAFESSSDDHKKKFTYLLGVACFAALAAVSLGAVLSPVGSAIGSWCMSALKATIIPAIPIVSPEVQNLAILPTEFALGAVAEQAVYAAEGLDMSSNAKHAAKQNAFNPFIANDSEQTISLLDKLRTFKSTLLNNRPTTQQTNTIVISLHKGPTPKISDSNASPKAPNTTSEVANAGIDNIMKAVNANYDTAKQMTSTYETVDSQYVIKSQLQDAHSSNDALDVTVFNDGISATIPKESQDKDLLFEKMFIIFLAKHDNNLRALSEMTINCSNQDTKIAITAARNAFVEKKQPAEEIPCRM